MSTIKVTYGQTSRKFTIPSNTTWSQFESHLHSLFNIPNETAISISYIDEDGDVISLSTDSELQQILSDQEAFGANVKFNISTSENPDNNGWVLENAEEKEDSVATLSDDDETNSKKDEEVVAYNIGEPSETENTENNENTENTENTEVTDVQTEQQQPAVEVNNYPSVTVTDEEDDPLFVPTLPKEEKSNKQSEELLAPVDSVNKEKEQNQATPKTPETPAESSNNANAEKQKANESDQESDDDSNVIFIVSSSPWIQRTYYRPRVNLFNSLLNGPTHFNHFARPSRPRYSYITPSYGFRRNPYFGSRGCGLTSRGFGGFSGFGSSGLYHFGL